MSDAGGGDKPLTYATPKRGRHREIRKKDLVIVFLGLCAILAAFKWQTIARVWVTTQAYIAQRRAMSYEPSPPRVAYTDDDAIVRKLPRSGDGAHFPSDLPAVAYYASPAWVEMQDLRDADRFPVTHAGDDATVFVHARRSKGAVERLVVVELGVGYNPIAGGLRERQLVIKAHSILPGSPFGFWSETSTPSALYGQLDTDKPITFYTGQADPKDPSHFTFAYTIQGRSGSGSVEGWLLDDGSVELKASGGKVYEFNGFAYWKP